MKPFYLTATPCELDLYVAKMMSANASSYQTFFNMHASLRTFYEKSSINIPSIFQNTAEASQILYESRSAYGNTKIGSKNSFATSILTAWACNLKQFLGSAGTSFFNISNASDTIQSADYDKWNQENFSGQADFSLMKEIKFVLENSTYFDCIEELTKNLFYGEAIILKHRNSTRKPYFTTALSGTYMSYSDMSTGIEYIIFPEIIQSVENFTDAFPETFKVTLYINDINKEKYYAKTVMIRSKKEVDGVIFVNDEETESEELITLDEQKVFYVRWDNNNSISPSSSQARDIYADVEQVSKGIDTSHKTDLLRARPILVTPSNSRTTYNSAITSEPLVNEIKFSDNTATVRQAGEVPADKAIPSNTRLLQGANGIFKTERNIIDSDYGIDVMGISATGIEHTRLLQVPEGTTYESGMFARTLNNIYSTLGLVNPYGTPDRGVTGELGDEQMRADKVSSQVLKIRRRIVLPIIKGVIAGILKDENKEASDDILEELIKNVKFSTKYEQIQTNEEIKKLSMLTQAISAISPQTPPLTVINADEYLTKMVNDLNLSEDIVDFDNLDKIKDIVSQQVAQGAQQKGQQQQLQFGETENEPQ